jgi:hypothetical protein
LNFLLYKNSFVLVVYFMGCKYLISDSFHLKVLEKCQLQETVKEKEKGLDSIGEALLF